MDAEMAYLGRMRNLTVSGLQGGHENIRGIREHPIKVRRIRRPCMVRQYPCSVSLMTKKQRLGRQTTCYTLVSVSQVPEGKHTLSLKLSPKTKMEGNSIKIFRTFSCSTMGAPATSVPRASEDASTFALRKRKLGVWMNERTVSQAAESDRQRTSSSLAKKPSRS
jgi:hypothetical protein